MNEWFSKFNLPWIKQIKLFKMENTEINYTSKLVAEMCDIKLTWFDRTNLIINLLKYQFNC